MADGTNTREQPAYGENTMALQVYLQLLEPFIKDPAVSEVCVNKPGAVFTEGGAHWKEHSVPELSYGYLTQLAQLIATSVSQRVSDMENLLSATLPDGERVQLVLPPSVPRNTISISIRTAPKAINKTLDEYQAEGYFDDCICLSPLLTDDEWKLLEQRNDRMRFQALAIEQRKTWLTRLNPSSIELLRLRDARDWYRFFSLAVKADQNIVISGGTASGKTTFTRTLINDIPVTERLITIEDTPELALPNHPNHVHLFYPKNDQSISNTTPDKLIASCLRMSPNRILMAELRGGETYDYAEALGTGHPGSITTCHAETPAEAMDQLAGFMKQHKTGANIELKEHLRKLYRRIHVVCQIHKDKITGKRHMTEVYYEPRCKEAGIPLHEFDFGAST